MAAGTEARSGTAAVHGALTEAKGVAGGLPDLLIEARRVSATVIAGWHGRRVAGRGETFWQFRPFQFGEPARSIDCPSVAAASAFEATALSDLKISISYFWAP